MAITDHERASNYPAIFDALALADVRSVTPSPNVEEMILTAAGALDPSFAQAVMQDPQVRLTTGQLATVLAACSPVTGLEISSGGEIQYQKRLDGGSFAGSGSHVTLNAAKGFLAPTEIRARQDAREGAELELLFYALAVGSNPAVAANAGQSLTGSPTVATAYKLGPVVYEGSIVGGVQGITVQTGIRYVTKRAAGEVEAKIGSILARAPVFLVEGDNLSLPANIGFGRKAASAGMTVYFQRVGGTNGQHVSFTLTAGQYVYDQTSGDGESDVTSRVRMTGTTTLTYSTTASLPS